MKHLFLLLSAILLLNCTYAQINLVLNPSFEQYAQCQYRASNIKYANYWTPITDTLFSVTDTLGPSGCTPEFCHTCMPGYCEVSIPLSTWYNHFPRTGQGMAHVIVYHSDTVDTPSIYRRDYLQGRLKMSLINGKKYSACFYISFPQISAYANNNIGAYLDNGSIDTTTQCGMPQTMYTPQVNDTSIYIDTLNWKKIEGTFIANGTEKFITIGNFFDDAHTRAVYINYWNEPSMYPGRYLVDDVAVIDCDNIPFAGEDVMIHPGDSTFLGANEQVLPYTWYILGNSVAIDSGRGIWVKPTHTTTYVLKQVLCGVTRYDTVIVNVWPIMVNQISKQLDYLKVYPNPATNELTIQYAVNCEVAIYDVMGRKVLSGQLHSEKETLDISNLMKGVYSIEFKDASSGERVIRKVVKE